MIRNRFLILIVCLTVFVDLVNAQQTKTASTSKQGAIVDEISLSASDIEDFKQQTKQKIEEFQQHIITIGSREQPDEKRDMAEIQALKLFYEGAIMEISSVKEDGSVLINSRTMAKYLARLKSLPYTKVEIKFFDIAYVSEFTKGPDGRYYTTATIIQEFTGFSGDNLVYTDVTKKEIEIVIDLVEDKFYNEKQWKIFLGDIKAAETKNKG